jgi:hypothetical protein
MAPTVQQLRAMTDDEVIKAHDDTTSGMGVSSSFYLDELRRRDAVRAEAASYKLATESQKLAERVMWLTIVNAVFAALAVAVAIVALFVR